MKNKKRLFGWLIFFAIVVVILKLTKPTDNDFKRHVNFNHKHTIGTLFEKSDYWIFTRYTEYHHLGDEPDAAEIYFIGIFGDIFQTGSFGYAEQ